jgi:hypothetical protein
MHGWYAHIDNQLGDHSAAALPGPGGDDPARSALLTERTYRPSPSATTRTTKDADRLILGEAGKIGSDLSRRWMGERLTTRSPTALRRIPAEHPSLQVHSLRRRVALHSSPCFEFVKVAFQCPADLAALVGNQ